MFWLKDPGIEVLGTVPCTLIIIDIWTVEEVGNIVGNGASVETKRAVMHVNKERNDLSFRKPSVYKSSWRMEKPIRCIGR